MFFVLLSVNQSNMKRSRKWAARFGAIHTFQYGSQRTTRVRRKTPSKLLSQAYSRTRCFWPDLGGVLDRIQDWWARAVAVVSGVFLCPADHEGMGTIFPQSNPRVCSRPWNYSGRCHPAETIGTTKLSPTHPSTKYDMA